jgi:hypothetical protein
MGGGKELSVVEISWVANPFRGDKFQEAWAPAAEAVVHYGAQAWAFLRSKDDPLHFTQLAVFDAKIDFERYWQAEETAEARIRCAGMYQVPILPVWHKTITFGAIADDVPNEEAA